MRICNQCGLRKDADDFHLKETTCKKCRHERRSELRRMKRLGVEKDVSSLGEEHKSKMDRVKKKYDKLRSKLEQRMDILEEKNEELVEIISEMKSKERRKKKRMEKVMDDVDVVIQGMERIRGDDMERWEEGIQLRDKVEQLCKDNIQLRHDVDQLQDRNALLVDENMQLRHDVNSLQDRDARLRGDVKVLQEETTSLTDDVGEMAEFVQGMHGQLQNQGNAMGFFTQMGAKLENVIQETKDSMDDKVVALKASVTALHKKNKTLQTSVELTNYRVQEVDEVSKQGVTEVEGLRGMYHNMHDTMEEMQSTTEHHNIRLTYVYNVFYKYITEKISQSGVTKRLRKKGYLGHDITPPSSVPPSPGIAMGNSMET